MRASDTEREQPAAPTAGDVLDRLQMALGVESDRELSRRLGQSPSAAGNWRDRGSVPYSHCVSVALELGLSLDWLLLGRGLPTYPSVAPLPSPRVEEPQPRAIEPRAVSTERAYFVRAGPPTGPTDRRLDAILRWWRTWWGSADEEERTWALVQLRRAIPESAEPIRRLTQEPTADDEANTGP